MPNNNRAHLVLLDSKFHLVSRDSMSHLVFYDNKSYLLSNDNMSYLSTKNIKLVSNDNKSRSVASDSPQLYLYMNVVTGHMSQWPVSVGPARAMLASYEARCYFCHADCDHSVTAVMRTASNHPLT